MATNLLKAGYPLVVFGLNKDAMKDLVKASALTAHSSEEAAERADVIITRLPDSPEGKRGYSGKERGH